MKKPFVLFITLAILAGTLSGEAEDKEKKSDLVRQLKTTYSSEPAAEMLERFVTLEVSPEWWTILLNDQMGPTGNRQGNPGYRLGNLADALAKVPETLGLGDFQALYRQVGYKASDPLLLDLMNSWKGKLSVTISMPFVPDASSVETTMSNLGRASQYWGNQYYVKPRGGKFFVNLTVSPSAKASTIKVSKDGNTYDVLLPARVEASGNTLDNGYKAGM